MWLIVFVHLFVCVFISEQHNLRSYWWIFFKFSPIVHICLSMSSLNFGDFTIAYFKAVLKLIDPLAWRRSALCECNSLVWQWIILLPLYKTHDTINEWSLLRQQVVSQDLWVVSRGQWVFLGWLVREWPVSGQWVVSGGQWVVSDPWMISK